MTRARDLADLAGSADAGGITGRNLIINGAMQVAQRGTSETGVTTTGYKTTDRWQFQLTTIGTWTVSQSTTAPDGFSNSYKLECTTADASPAGADNMAFKQRIEGQNLQHLKYGTASAQPMTLSFWVRSSKTGTYVCELLQPDASNRHINKSYTISSANTWEYKTITFAGDSSGVINNDNGEGLQVNWWLGSGSGFSSGTLQTSWGALDQTARAVGNVNLADSTSNDWYITGVQLEVGETATPFEHRSYGDELARCQRYYQKDLYEGNTVVEVGTVVSSSSMAVGISYSGGQMRTAPTITLPTAGQGANLLTFLEADSGYPSTTGTFATAGISNIQFRLFGSGYVGTFVAGESSWLYPGPASGSVYFEYDAEL